MVRMQYRPLDPFKSEIRLIELLPRDTTNTSQREPPPRCNILYTSLEENPKYSALSYVWGDPQDTDDILVGHTSFTVTRNLYSALCHLRSDTTAKVFWIDALCIDQLDEEEKSCQVQLMREIYGGADFVSIWLGPGDLTSDDTMDFLHSFGTKAMDLGIDSGPDLARMQWRKLASHPPSFRDRSTGRIKIKYSNAADKELEISVASLNDLYYSINGLHERDFLLPVDGMADLFKRPWWGRTWVLQEISLARKAGFICGAKKLSRRRCTAAINAFCALRSVLQEAFISKRIIPTAYQKAVSTAFFDTHPTVMLCMWDTVRYSPYPLLALLRATCIGEVKIHSTYEFHNLEATDPLDKIYGLLGLAADRNELKSLGVEPRYTLSCQKLYTNVTAAILRQGHLSVLSLCQFPKTQVGLPSWVPDWSKPFKIGLQGTQKDHMTLSPKYGVSGGLQQTVSFCSDGESTVDVLLSGFVCDKIATLGITWAEICPRKNSTPHPYVWGKRWLSELVRLSSLCGNVYKNQEERVHAAARTATADVALDDNGCWERGRNTRFRAAAMLLMMQIDDLGGKTCLSFDSSKIKASVGLQVNIDQGIFHETLKYTSEIGAKGRDWKPFATEKGHLGLGPNQIEPGDSIGIFAGAQVPFVLRPGPNGKYQLIGETYVDGIMDGEAVEGRENLGVIKLY